MKVSGFTIVRNAVKFDYPVKEAILSALPLCDEFIIAVGNSEDNTLELVKTIADPRIKIIESTWDDSLRVGGRVLAAETDKAMKNLSADADWLLYIQADEVIPEDNYDELRRQMLLWKDDANVEGLLFNYRHFYGTYDFVASSRKWYRREVRIIKNIEGIHSWRDAQGFRRNGKHLQVKPTSAFIHHYGWVKPPELQQTKQQHFHRLWHSDEWMKKNIGDADSYDYSGIDILERFNGKHPVVMQERIRNYHCDIPLKEGVKQMSIKNAFLYLIEKLTGIRLWEYKNYRKI